MGNPADCGSLARACGELDSDGGERMEPGSDQNIAAVRVSDPLGDAKSKTRAIDGLGMRGIAAIEALEHARQLFGRNTLARVAHGQLGLAVVAPQTKSHFAIRLIILNSVVGNVEEQLPKAMAISPDGDFITNGQIDFHPGRLGQNLGINKAIAYQLIQPHGFRVQCDLSCVRFGKSGETIDDFGEALDFFELIAENLALGGSPCIVAKGRLNFGAHDGKRRLQFVGGVQGKFADAEKGSLEAFDHRVEHASEAVEFIAIAGAWEPLL